MLTLYYAPGSSSMAPHIALHEIGEPFEARLISFARKEHRSDAFRKINPEGKVPTLSIDGRVLTEVSAILYYLARRFPKAGLWPDGDLEAEAQCLSWMSFIASTLHPARARGMEHAQKVWQDADRRLGNREWAIGRYSIADIHLFRLFWRLRRSLQPPPDLFPALEAHHARMLPRPAVQRALEIESAAGYELPA
jgi:glutathione S-transferase